MKKLITLVLILALTMSLFVGCGGSDETSNPATSVEATSVTVTMADGEKALPTEFGNFAILDFAYLEHCIHLGVTPVASPITSEPAVDAAASSIVSYLDGYGSIYPDRSVLDGIEAINASDDGIDIEQLLALDIDYIITSESNLVYADKLNMVAPTYFIPSTITLDENGEKDWKQLHMVLGQLVGAENEAQANIDHYDATLAEYQAIIGEMLEGKTAIVTQISTKGVQYSIATSHPHVYSQLGLSVPASFPETSGYLALENLIEYDPDYLFINVESWEDFATYEASPIWQNLTAVQNDDVFEFAHYVWNRSSGSISAYNRMVQACEFIINGTQTTNRYDYI